ncbi:MAG: prephenate dehydratase [Tidjanibacter sp.]|nr:prephenate dehydratase [Tidjanibacter sp.]
MRVAIQGYEGSFHDIVAREYFGGEIVIVPCDTFKEVAALVEQGKVERGVMAIENSIAGSILPNYRLLQNDNLQVAGEAILTIRQNLLALPGVKMEDIREVHSHHMALMQCDEFLENHRWRLVETEDTALSAKLLAADGDTSRAVVASRLAAELFGLKVMAADIHTIKNNYTRFMILKRHDHTIASDANKASLYFSARHEQGSLLKVLREMGSSAVNLTKLQSYPIPSEPWHYMFHVDMEFDSIYEWVRVLDKLQEVAQSVHVYGVYKRGREFVG